MKAVEDFESRPHKAVSFLVGREKRRYRNGMSRSCQRRCLVTVEAGGVGGRRRDEAAAKNEGDERYDEEDWIKRKDVC